MIVFDHIWFIHYWKAENVPVLFQKNQLVGRWLERGRNYVMFVVILINIVMNW